MSASAIAAMFALIRRGFPFIAILLVVPGGSAVPAQTREVDPALRAEVLTDRKPAMKKSRPRVDPRYQKKIAFGRWDRQIPPLVRRRSRVSMEAMRVKRLVQPGLIPKQTIKPGRKPARGEEAAMDGLAERMVLNEAGLVRDQPPRERREMSLAEYHAMVDRLTIGDFNRFRFRKNGMKDAPVPVVQAGGGSIPGVER